MGSKFDLEMILQAKDYASKVIKEVANRTKKSTQEVENQAKKSAQTQQRETQKTARITEQSYRQISQMARQATGARESLGIRSERSIQREIQRTRLEYERLKSSGMASSRELSRAYDAMQNRVRALNAEMGKLSAGQKMMNVGRGVAGVAAGVTAGAMVMREPVRKQMSFDRQLAMVANTAFAERDVAGRIAGKKELFNAVEKAVEVGGGTKEDALGALDKLLASGSVSAETAMNLLPTLQKGSVATGASTEDLAQIAISAMQQFNIKEEDIGKVLDMAVAAGQAGNFELADMARWLPQQMAAAKSAGLTGLDGLESLLVANQQARVTAGTSDEAGNNLVNLLAKITAKETNERFKKIDVKKNGKVYGIDFLKSMEDYKAKGQDSLQAFMSIMEDVIGHNEEYKALQQKLKTAKTEERKALLDQMANLVEGTAIGGIISDRQALMALLGIRNNVQLGEDVRKEIQQSDGATEKSHQVIQDTNDYKVETAKATAEFAQMKAMEGFNNQLGNVSEKLVEYAKEYPELTTALAGAVTGIAALGVGAATAGAALAALGYLNKNRLGMGGDDLIDTGNKKSPKTGGRSSKMSGRFGNAFGFLAKASIVGEALFHSEELNKGEDDQLEIMRRISDGSATPEQKALSDAGYSASKADAEARRQRREQYEKEKGFTPLNDDEQRRYQQALTAQLQHNTQRQFEQATSVLNGWFSSKAEKADAMKRLDSLDSNLLSDTQRKEIDSIKLKEQQDKVNQARSVVNGFGFLTASEEEKAEAKAVLEHQNKLTEKIPINAVNNTNIQLPAEDKKAFLDSQVKFSEDIQSLGVSILEGFKQAIAAQEHTIKNLITVELDGRVIAEQTSEYQYREMVRG